TRRLRQHFSVVNPPRPVVGWTAMRVAVLGLVLLAAGSARAHHRQTPPIVAITTSGEASLPRFAPPSRKAAAAVVGHAGEVVTPFHTPTTPIFTYGTGNNDHPTVNANGRVVVWDTDADPLGSGAPGRQVVQQGPFGTTQLAVDPTGTSANPSVDYLGIFA